MSRAARRPPPLADRRGMTLIEIVLAVAIAVVVVTLVLSVYHTVTVTLQRQQERQAGPAAAAAAAQQLAHDLACTFAAWNDPAMVFSLSVSNEADSEISFCTAVLPEGETDPRWFELQQVAYRVAADPARERALTRESRPLVGPGAMSPPVTNLLATGIEQFRVTAFDGTNWSESWPLPGASACPRAARIEIRARQATGTRDFEMEVLIPAGNVVTSRLIRTATPGSATPTP
jgi:prepilin-type N-terminal cleavage/methylation domain-containing protein